MYDNEKIKKIVFIFLLLFIVLKTMNLDLGNVLIIVLSILYCIYYFDMLKTSEYSLPNDIKSVINKDIFITNTGRKYLSSVNENKFIILGDGNKIIDLIEFTKEYNYPTHKNIKFQIYKFFNIISKIEGKTEFKYEYLQNLNKLRKDILNNLESLQLSIPTDDNIKNKLHHLIDNVNNILIKNINKIVISNKTTDIDSSHGIFSLEGPEGNDLSHNNLFDYY